jgi:hypothetical protein
MFSLPSKTASGIRFSNSSLARRIGAGFVTLMVGGSYSFISQNVFADEISSKDILPVTGLVTGPGTGLISGSSSPSVFEDTSRIPLSVLEPVTFKNEPIVETQIIETTLHGAVSINEQITGPKQIIDHLLEAAAPRDTERANLEKGEKLHSKKWTRMFGRSKDMLQFMTSYQGFESSSEGADVILGEKLKLKHRAAIEYVKQKLADEAHLQLTCAIMEIATGLGLDNELKRKQAIDSATAEMIPLVGEKETADNIQAMIEWAKRVAVPESTYAQETWDVLGFKKKSTAMLAYSLERDDVVKSIEDRLHKYNRHSSFSRATSKFVNTSCSLIALTPTFASPAAQAAQFVYVACTGGPEEKKLLREVYLDRCFDSRFNRLNQEISLVASGYNNAILTHNPVLYSCATSLMQELTSADMVAALTNTKVDDSSHAVAGKVEHHS